MNEDVMALTVTSVASVFSCAQKSSNPRVTLEDAEPVTRTRFQPYLGIEAALNDSAQSKQEAVVDMSIKAHGIAWFAKGDV